MGRPLQRVSYLDILELYVVAYIEEMQPVVTLQHEGATSHRSNNVRKFLLQTFSGRWIGWGGASSWLPWYGLVFLSVRLCEGLCLLNICGWHCNLLCEDNQNSPKCGKRNVDSYMCRTGLWADGVRAIRGSLAEVDYKVQEYSWVKEQSANTKYFCLFWLSSITF